MSLPETYKALISNEQGELSLKEFPLPKPSTNQVLVKVAYAPINPSDIAKLKGFYGKSQDYTTTLRGSEGSGIIVAVGNDLTIPYKVDDRVHIKRETWGEYMLAESEDINRILQDDLSMEEAACHFVNPATVYYMAILVKKGNHKAVIHTAGSSAIGRMMIRYFKHKGLKLINIVRREEVIEELKKEGAYIVLNSKADDFEEKLKEVAEKEGATVCFESIVGDMTGKILKNMPENSTVHIYGALSDLTINKLGVSEFIFQGKSVTGFWLGPYIQQVFKREGGAEVFQKTRKEVLDLLPNLLSSPIMKVFDLEKIDEALEFNDKNSSKGKTLLKLN